MVKRCFRMLKERRRIAICAEKTGINDICILKLCSLQLFLKRLALALQFNPFQKGLNVTG